MTVELFGNGGTTTLTAAVDSLETTLTVTSASGFPAAPGRYRIRVDDELMIVTNGLGTTTWTVTRGAESTTAASHASGATVRHVLTAGAMPAALHASRSFLVAAAGDDTLTLGATPYQESLQVFINGSLKRPGTDYTTAGKVVTFTPALAGGEVVSDHYLTQSSAPVDSVLSVAPKSYSQTVLADSPIAYYRLGEASGTVASDAGANAINGAYVNAPLLATTGLIAGDTNTAVACVASNSNYVESANSALLNRADIMIEVWLKAEAATAVICRDLTGAGGWFLNGAGTNVTMRVSDVDYTTTVTRTSLLNTTRHLVWGANATTVYLYVDGALAWSAARTGTAIAAAVPWRLGRNGTTTQYSSGVNDEWAFYPSLTAERITAHYNRGIAA